MLEWAEVATPSGIDVRVPEDFDFSYRRSNVTGRQIVIRAQFGLETERAGRSQGQSRRSSLEAPGSSTLGIKTFGSTFKNPDDPRADGRTAGQLLEAAGCKGLEVGGARFSPKHANFVDNQGEATTQDVIGLIAEGRRRVEEDFGITLETEVQVLGEVDPTLWKAS